MSMQELKTKIKEAMSRPETNLSEDFETVQQLLSEYENSNKNQEYTDVTTGDVGSKKDVILKRRSQEELNTKMMLMIESNKQEIKKELASINGNIEFLNSKISSVNSKSDTNTKLISEIIKKEEPKQERFYHYSDSDAFHYLIKDRQGIFNFSHYYTCVQARDVVLALNKMEYK